jgi:hypothetical protein
MKRSLAVLLLALTAACAQRAGGEPEERAAPVRHPPAEARAGRVVVASPEGGPSREELSRLAAELDRAVAEMAPRIPLPGSALEEPVRVVVHPEHVAQAQAVGAVGAGVAAGREVHLVLHPEDAFAYRFALAQALIARARTGDAPPWIDAGAALWLSGEWYGRPWREWLPELAAAGALPEPARLLASEMGRDGSEPLWAPAAAAVVESLPGATLREKLKGPGPISAQRVEAAYRGLPRRRSPARRASEAPRGFLRGVSLAMTNRAERGYHAPVVDDRLARLREVGADAVALMPFAYQPGADQPELRFLNHRPGAETDAGMVYSTRRARAGGFRVLYKPHLWVSHHSWPGEIAMRTEEDWARWWSAYRRYILHHAFLARWAGADLFSVGVELSKTVGREREWRELIAAVRVLYPGPVTYAANWYGEPEEIPFWDALDVIGVDCYYPLADSPEAGPAALRAGSRAIAERLAALSRRHGKRVLLTELGFAARRAAWTNPHQEGGELSEADQARAYEALLGALGRPRWLAGAFVWKAFTGIEESGQRADFGFLGRPAEAVIRGWYETGRPAPATP